MTHILARQAAECEEYLRPARIFCKYASAKIAEAAAYIEESTVADVETFKK